VVELVQHLGFVQRKVTIMGAGEDVPFPPVAVRFGVLCRAQMVGIRCHVKKPLSDAMIDRRKDKLLVLETNQID
jgi:hypothetical protein